MAAHLRELGEDAIDGGPVLRQRRYDERVRQAGHTRSRRGHVLLHARYAEGRHMLSVALC